MQIWLQAGLWGLLAGSALLLGAAAGYLINLPQRIIASIMAFGSGVLISALSFDLMDEAYRTGGFGAVSLGFVLGSAIYSAATFLLNRRGAKHRKRSGGQQPSEQENESSGMAIAVGSLIDGIPESIVIGLSLLEGSSVSMIAVIAIFLSNIPEGLSSSVGMRKAGRSRFYVFLLWAVIAVASGVASLLGYTVFSDFSRQTVATTTSLAAGGMLTMLVDTMIPEAFEEAHDLAGMITVIGFLCAFMLTKSAH